MDSMAIAQELEKTYPSPSLHLSDPVVQRVVEMWGKITVPLRGVLMAKTPRNILNPVSVEYFERTRAERFGMPLLQLEREEGGEGAWREVEPTFRKSGGLLEASGGAVFLGEGGQLCGFCGGGGPGIFQEDRGGGFREGGGDGGGVGEVV